MTDFEVYEVEVPVGHRPGNRPTKPETRLPKELIKIVPCEESDMEEWAALCYDAFPDNFFDHVETKDRPPLAERIRLMGKHWNAWRGQPGYHTLKAVHGETGELMGIAGWHESGTHDVYPTQYACMPGYNFPSTFVPGAWHSSMYGELGITKRMGWSEAEVREITSWHGKAYADEFDNYDRGRLGELGDRPHFYLAPLAVWKKWEGRGVGSELLRWGISRAKERGWATILEALPSAKPVYLHHGFKFTKENGPFKEDQMMIPAKADS